VDRVRATKFSPQIDFYRTNSIIHISSFRRTAVLAYTPPTRGYTCTNTRGSCGTMRKDYRRRDDAAQAQALTPVPPFVAFVPFASCAQQPGRRIGRSARSPPPFRPGSPSTPPPRSRRRPFAHGRTSRRWPPGALPAGKRHIPDRLLPPTAPAAPPGISVRRLSAEAAAGSVARRTTLQTKAHAVSCSLDTRAT
jgi:hypothetical protein